MRVVVQLSGCTDASSPLSGDAARDSDHPDARAPRGREPGPARAGDPPAAPRASAPGKGAATAALTQESLLTAARPPAKRADLRCGTLVCGEFGGFAF